MDGATDILKALGVLSPNARDLYAEVLRHAARAVGQAIVSAATPPDVHEDAPAAPLVAKIESRAARVLAAAAAEWRRVVCEPGTPGMPNGAHIIDSYIRGPLGLGWDTADVRTWAEKRPGVPYTRNGQFAWCGAAAAFCYGAAGLKASVRYKRLAGTGRIYSWARHTDRWIEPGDLQPGDIAVCGPSAGDADGEHIVIVREVLSDHIATIEGNARGTGPGGEEYEGVIFRMRPFRPLDPVTYRVLYGVRPLAEDYEP